MPYDEAVDGRAVDAYLTAHPGITVVSVVHSETPSGTLNPVWDIGPIARRHGAVTVVDAVSSFGGIELRPEEWQLDLLVAGPQKCLGGPPGMSLMALSERAWAAIDANPDAPRDSFLSITDWRDKWHGQGRFPYTPSVSDLHGVDAAADELLAEGLDASIARHQRVFDACWAGVEAMGLRPWPVSKAIASACVSAIRVPDGLTDAQVRDHAPRALRRPVLGGPGRGQHHPHRPHGRHGAPDDDDRRAGRPWADARRPRRARRGRRGPGCGAGLALGDRRRERRT